MNIGHDVEVIFQFIDEKRDNVYEGYRPAHLIKEGCLTTGVHKYYNINETNEELRGTITFIDPESYPACLWIGKKLDIYEGCRKVGSATILQIVNPILENRVDYNILA